MEETKDPVRGCYDILKGCLTGLAVDSWRYTYLMSNLDRLYEAYLTAKRDGVVASATRNRSGRKTKSVTASGVDAYPDTGESGETYEKEKFSEKEGKQA